MYLARPATFTAAILLCLGVYSSPQAAAEPLDSILGSLSWGASTDAVLQVQRERVLQGYRVEVAGVVDPLQVDRIRRRADDRIESIERTMTALDGARSGFEVSAIRGEVVAGAGQSVLNARWPEGHLYFVFDEGALRRMMIVLDPNQFQGLDFEEFAEALDARYPVEGERGEGLDDIGRRILMRMTWTDDTTQVRLENRARMFQSWVLVVSDATWDGPVPALDAPSSATARTRGARRSVSDLIGTLEASDTAQHDALIDDLFGTRVEVRTMLRSDEERAAEEEEAEERRREEAEAEARALEERRARERARRAREQQQRPAEQPEEGVTFYD